jgi:hypothetical protein
MMDSNWSLREVGRSLQQAISGTSYGPRSRRPLSRPLDVEWLERRELLSTTQNFDTTTGTTYALQQVGGPPPAMVEPSGPTGNFLRLATTSLSPLEGNNNSISFVTSDPGTFTQVVADWDFRVTQTTPGQKGLGMSFALLSTGSYGTSGQAASPLPQQGIYNGSLALGFDTANDPL